MYAHSFGLTHEPFSIAPDPRYLFMSERHREALAHLLYGLGGGGGFVLLTGEIGTGKTTVCRCFLEQVPAGCHVAYIFNPRLTVHELLQIVCDEFGVPHAAAGPGPETARDCIEPLNAFLLRTHAAGESAVLVIDEAQNLSADVLEQLRLLTNLETSERKLLQIVLIGQPELRGQLARPELEQLAQRVIARYHLDALSEAETAQYVAHRLAVAGHAGALPFDRGALRRIHRATRGVPRRINLLCGRALLGAYARGRQTVDRRMVDQAAREVFGTLGEAPAARGPRRGWVLAGGGLLAGAALAAGAFVWAPGRTGTPGPAAPLAASPVAPKPERTAPESERALPTATAPAASDLAGVFAEWPRQEDAAWRALAPAWGVAAPAAADGDPCRVLARRQLACFRGSRIGLGLLRQLDRPGVLTLYDEAQRPAYALLTGLDGDAVVLQAGDRTVRVPPALLAAHWRGEFATLWREGAPADPMAGSADDWLAAQLARTEPPAAGPPPSLRNRIYRFQLAQGLTPDGRAGPITFMQLNRATGVDEPRLAQPPVATPSPAR
ncbi:AAA family ATPase [uncultured Xylophilus sp.]|uniref:ExeA family protein n=1 Tax=uncultured Xylophilus sp. TaxID=296832 RepID=UPI0025FEBDB2|nr:AAA family ATPase [uncultured Xylophilus sp.]